MNRLIEALFEKFTRRIAQRFNAGSTMNNVKSLEGAKLRGYPLGRREKDMLADGFRRHGGELEAQAQLAQGNDRDDLRKQPENDFQQALRYYEEIFE